MSKVQVQAATAQTTTRRTFNLAHFLESYALVAALVLLGAVFGALRPEAFLSWANISTMLGRRRCWWC